MLSNIYIILSIIAIIGSLIVISARNPIHRIASLVVVFMVGSIIFMILDYYFLGLTYIIVYVGAIAIIFLFVIMMVQIPITTSNNISENVNYIGMVGSNTKENIKRLNIIKSSKEIKENNKLTILLQNMRNNENQENNEISLLNEEIRNDNKEMKKNIIIILIIISIIIIGLKGINASKEGIYTYMYPEWSIEYKTMTDIETLGYVTYIGYPIALVLIGILLWAVLIGIISICKK